MKQIIRGQMLAKRKTLNVKEVERCGDLVYENLLKISEFKLAKSCFCYCDFKNEVPTKKIRNYFSDKILYEPKIVQEDMFAVLKVGDNTLQNKYGIQEATDYKIIKKSADISIIPLIACDRQGNRVGFGKGYYDGYLKDKHTLKIGICYSWQIVESVPTRKGDIPLDYIVTEKEIIKVK